MFGVTLSPERRRQLQQLGLRALVRRRFGADAADGARTAPFAGGAAIVTADGRRAAVFADSPAGLGAAVDLARREDAEELFFFAELNTPDVARRAAEFAFPIVVVNPDGEFEPLEPGAPPVTAPMPAVLAATADRLRGAGLEAVWEHGVLTGEWLGLEVAPATPTEPLSVGVGRHDREANLDLYPDGPPDSFLDQAVAAVRDLRRPGAPSHAANQLAPERWLRAVLRAHPEMIGFGELRPGPTPEAREDLRRRAIAPAWGRAADGSVAVVACSAGGDPDVIAQAADARLQAPLWPDPPPEAEPGLVVVIPEPDDHPAHRRLAGLLRRPASVVTVPGDWRLAGPAAPRP